MVSVIVPAYNVGPFIKDCLESVRKQSLHDIEVIVVDDGSTDRSGEVADGFSQADPRFKVVHKSNGGPSSARNAGLNVASGEFVFFLDGDDRIDPRCLEILVGAAGCNDMVVTGFNEIGAGESLRSPALGNSVGSAVSDPMLKFLRRQHPMRPSVCDALFRSSLIDGERFNEALWCGEDGDWKFRVLQNAKGVVGVSDMLVYYVRRLDSAMRGGSMDVKLTHIAASESVLRRARRLGGSERAAAYFFTFWDMVNSPVLLPDVARRYPNEYRHCVKLLRETAAVVVRDTNVGAAHRAVAGACLLSPMVGKTMTVLAKRIRRHRRVS